MHNTEELYQFRSSYTSNDGSPLLDDPCVTKSRSAETEAGLPEADYKEYTHMIGCYQGELPAVDLVEDAREQGSELSAVPTGGKVMKELKY
jgi:hypothetical protein